MRRLLLTVLLFVISSRTALCDKKATDLKTFIEQGRKYNVRILRDKWGVPHVFGKTDADAAFGLAYAHAEDDCRTTYMVLLAVRGKVASVEGIKGVPFDCLCHMLRVREKVAKNYTVLSERTRALLEGYAAGATYYAALHPDQINSELLPFTGQDIVAGFVMTTPAFYGVAKTLLRLIRGGGAKAEGPFQESLQAMTDYFGHGWATGSNAFAVAPTRSADGKTRLAVNSHQPWEGPLAWYEAHVHSEEGWNMVGGLFPGAPVVLHGHNPNLGWAHTNNRPDLVDVYVLKTNPQNPNQYMFDGRWYDLETKSVDIEVHVHGDFSTHVKQKFYWSPHHGPVVKCADGTYAIRYAAMDEVRHVEQWYRMNKARNLDEFMDALSMQALPFWNICYADKEGNVFYLYNAALPIRPEGYDWRGRLPGDTSETLWTEYLPLEKLPQVFNPPSGFVQNCNNTPFQTTVGPGNPDPKSYSTTFGIETLMTNRALRVLEIFGEDKSITREDFLACKFDVKYSKKSVAGEVFKQILALAPPDDPDVREALELMRTWDFSADPENTHAAIAILALEPICRARMFHRPEPDTLEIIRRVARRLKKAHGRLDVPWKTVNRLRRGDIDVGLGGGPDALRAIYGHGPGRDGRITGQAGDSYVLIAEWDKEGNVRSDSIHQYGSATSVESSPHYADQAPLFAQQKLKPVWFTEEDIRRNLEREYRPGEEMER